uniref:Putative hormone receptor 4 n=1 Tax=Anopheles braziliensis TaxID=58242 RepID=A0A2M3ZMA2_9DIPT
MRKRLPRTVLRVVVAEALAQEASVLPAHSSRAVAAMEPHGMRGFATYSGDESPPPDYNVVVHDNRASGHHTLGRLPSQHAPIMGPNNGKYATLSKQCKTLESNDFY